jgi:hypothetical protein
MVDGFEHRGWNPETFNDSAHRTEVFRVKAEVFFGGASGSDGVAHELPIPKRDENSVPNLETRDGEIRVDGVRAARAWVERDINDLDLRAHGLEFG